MPDHLSHPPLADTVRTLAERVRQIEGEARWKGPAGDDDPTHISSGSRTLDRLLPSGGLSRGTLVEWLAGASGSGTATLALLAAREASREAGAVVVLDRRQWFYPPAAVSLGVELEKLLVIRPRSKADEAWALDQSLRCSGVAAVLAWPEELDDHTFRRLQLAAETSGVLGLFVRPQSARAEPSWAELRLEVSPLPTQQQWGGIFRRRLRVELLRCRGGQAGGSVEIEIEEGGSVHETATTNSLHLASPLAARASGRRSRGA